VIITIDGPAGSGKSTVAKRLATHLGMPYIDTGAMYRSVAVRAIDRGVPLEDASALVRIAEALEFEFRFRGGSFVTAVSEKGAPFEETGTEIRTPEVSMASSKIAQWAELRKVLVKKQQANARNSGGILEGRDAGTVIFPEADIKFFLTASAEERASRRHRELIQQMGRSAPPYGDVLSDVQLRDRQDQGRKASPLRPAKDAHLIDSSQLDEEEVFAKLTRVVEGFQKHHKAQDLSS